MAEKAQAQAKPTAKPISTAAGNTLQRKCDCGQHKIAGGECSTCSQKGEVFKRTAISRPSQNRDSPETSVRLSETLRSTRQPLEPAVSLSSRQRFDQDFARIKAFDREPGYAAQMFPTSPINLESKTIGWPAVAVDHRNLMRAKAINLKEKNPDDGGSATPGLGSTTPDVGPTSPGVGSTQPGVGPTTPGAGSAEPGGASPASATKKKAGVDSFSVKWTKNSSAGPTNARLRLDFKVKFKNDADHDPSFAEFRQNAGSQWEVTDGPHKGQKRTTAIRDDGYSRADDKTHTKADVDFVSNDNPGLDPLSADDVLDYSFTAEQLIIDTNDGNKEIAKKGPHTGTIKGKDPRTYDGVPKDL
jgi:hypothetical protein